MRLNFFTVLAAIALTGGTATAQPAPQAQVFANGVAVLKAKLGPQKEFREPPAATDAEAARAWANVRSSMAVFGTPAFPVRDYETFEAVCGPLNEMSVQIAMAGAGGGKLAALKDKPDEGMKQLRTLMQANNVKHQDVLLMLASSNVKCMALHLPFFERFWEALPADQKTPVRADGLRQMRTGAANMLTGIAINGVDPQMKLANRTIAIQAAAAYAPAYARTMSLVQRKALMQTLSKSAPGLAARYPQEYKAIARALSDQTCVALCVIP